MRVNREELLHQLKSVEAGLSRREIIEQSSCFIFKDGKVSTFNDEIACSQSTCLDVEGAVQADPLIAILDKLQEEAVEVQVGEEELLIKGKNRRAGIRMEVEVVLPVDCVEPPKKWKSLPEDFTDAINIVKECAGSDESQFELTCIHLYPKWIEASDGSQLARYRIKMDVKQSTLVRKESLKHIIELDMKKFSETKNWIHFKNTEGLVLSCRRYFKEEYPHKKITRILKASGLSPIVLPKGLKAAADKAEVFSNENAEDSDIEIKLQPDRILITGRGASGWFKEKKKIAYKGPSLSFLISPILLREMIERHNKCEISNKILKARVGKFSYVTALGSTENADE